MLPLQRWLSSDEAAPYLRPYTAFRRVGARIGMDVDPQVLSFGSNNSGAGLFTGGRVPSLSLVNPKGSTFIEGDLYVDGWLENPGGLVFVRGNLMAQTLYTSGYLVVLGELRVRRLFGEDEPLGTYVFGDAYVESAIFNHNHPFDVWGKAELGDLVHDETHGREAVRERLAAQGVLSAPRYEDFLVDVQMGLRNQAERWGSLPEDWVTRKYTPKPGDIDAGKLPPRTVAGHHAAHPAAATGGASCALALPVDRRRGASGSHAHHPQGHQLEETRRGAGCAPADARVKRPGGSLARPESPSEGEIHDRSRDP